MQVEKNILISNDTDDEQKLKEITEEIDKFENKTVKKSVTKYEKLIDSILTDFVDQKTKKNVGFVTVKPIMCDILQKKAIEK